MGNKKVRGKPEVSKKAKNRWDAIEVKHLDSTESQYPESKQREGQAW